VILKYHKNSILGSAEGTGLFTVVPAGRRNCAEHHGLRLCPARRGISRSASGSQGVLGISEAVIPAKLLRLVCDTAAVRARLHQRSATPLSCGRRCARARGSRVRAKAPSPLRFAGAVHDANGIAGRVGIARSVMECGVVFLKTVARTHGCEPAIEHCLRKKSGLPSADWLPLIQF